jgi:hypothetical protein
MIRGFSMLRLIRRFFFLLSAVAVCAASYAAGDAVAFKRAGDSVEIQIGGKPFAVYHFDAKIAKPFMSQIRSAQGTIITRGFPMVEDIPGEPRDEPHQRALYFAHGLVNGFDFWGEAAFAKWSDDNIPFGRTVFRKLDAMQGGPDSGSLQAEFDLLDSNGKTIGAETQAYVFHGDADSRAIDCEFTIHANHGPVILGDTKEGTFAIRLAKELDSPPGHMVNSNGAEGEKGVWGQHADWVDYDGKVGGEELGVAIFDNPQNLRHPTTWHARGYGLFAANPFGLKQFTHDPHQDGSYTIPAGGSLVLRYRVFIHHGDYRQAQVAKAYQAYAAGK